MADDPARNVPPAEVGPDKLLAIGAYGESVAAYRYLVLSEQAPTEEHRRLFAAIADEEQGHKQRLQKLLLERYPDADFVLTAEDKEQVITGPRLLDVHKEVSFAEAMRMLLETERKVAAFYARHAGRLTDPGLRTLFRQLAEEGGDHYRRLRELAREVGVSASDGAA